jgi:mRNA-degrading endonuclease RelE of RelBE toxin-antitoxin system
VTLGHRFHPEAERELFDAAAWFEARRPGLGDRFADAVDEIFASIHAAPNGGTRWREGPARTWRVRRFPFIVVYAVEPDGIVIVALAHTKRRPGYWMARIA